MIIRQLLAPVPSDQLLAAVDYLIERIDKIVLNDYVKLFERLQVVLLPLDDVLRGHVSEAEQEALLLVEVDVLPP